MGTAALDAGVTLYSGTVPLVLQGEHFGQAIIEDIWAIASAPATLIGGLEIMELDCSCNPMIALDPRSQQ